MAGESFPKRNEDTVGGLRALIAADPGAILDDPDVMRALIAASDGQQSANIVDLRTVAMDRMEARLGRLEDTHRSVVAAAYDNLAGTNQVHRAILRMLEPADFDSFLRDLGGEVADILRVDKLRLVLESVTGKDNATARRLSATLSVAEPGFVSRYIGGGQGAGERTVVLRQVRPEPGGIYGEDGADIRSEAALRLDLGAGRLPAMLVMGSEDPHHFRPSHGTDLLSFFAAVFERSMRRWLA